MTTKRIGELVRDCNLGNENNHVEIAKRLYILNVFNCKFVVIKKWYIV